MLAKLSSNIRASRNIEAVLQNEAVLRIKPESWSRPGCLSILVELALLAAFVARNVALGFSAICS